MRRILLCCVLAGCASKPPVAPATPTSPKTPATPPVTARTAPPTIDRLCKALEVCSNAPGLCDSQIGLNIWQEDSGWAVKVVMGKTGETGKQALINLDAGTCDGVPAKLPDVAGGVTIESVLSGIRACVN